MKTVTDSQLQRVVRALTSGELVVVGKYLACARVDRIQRNPHTQQSHRFAVVTHTLTRGASRDEITVEEWVRQEELDAPFEVPAVAGELVLVNVEQIRHFAGVESLRGSISKL
jgi:hypothetical protein